MFGKMSGAVSWINRRKLAVLAPLAVVSVAGATYAADPWDHWHRNRHEVFVRRGPEVVIEARPRVVVTEPPVVVAQTPPVIVTAARGDIVPSEVHFSAYQTRDAVIVLVSGTNSGAGYATSLTAVDTGQWTPTLQMRNCPPGGDVIAGAATPFILNAAIHVTHALSSVNIVVAGQTYQVPVTEVQSLS